MPRSGSTLLQNILAQNPNIVSSPTSILGELVGGALNQIRQSTTTKAEGYDNIILPFQEFLKDGMKAWGDSKIRALDKDPETTYYIDKSRSWLFQKDLLQDMYGDDFKILCIVRDLKGVVSSMEKNHRSNIYRADHIVDSGAGNMIQRINGYLNSVPVNPFLNKVVDLLQCQDTRNIIFIKYEYLIAEPKAIMDSVYEALGLPAFEHDFDNIQQLTNEDDEFHGIYGQHKIKSKITNPGSDGYFNDEVNKMIDDSCLIYQTFFGYI